MPDSEQSGTRRAGRSGTAPPAPRRHPVVRGAIWAVLLLGVVAATWFAVRQARLTAGFQAEAGRLGAEVKTLETRLAEVTRERDALLRDRGDLPPVRPGGDPSAALESEAAARAAADAATINQLKEAAATASALAGKLETRVAELEADLERVGEENNRRSASQVELGEKISGLSRIIEALERENKTKGDRLVQLELANKQVREDNARLTQKSGESIRMSVDLQELYRRREVHISSILSRYRELTDQFRALSGMLESRGRQEGAAGMPDLGRLQNTMSLAEEDMRQLSNLNAQVLQVQRKMNGK